ncbi:thioredoxin domain-containing protein 17 [Mantella aurantiaca]
MADYTEVKVHGYEEYCREVKKHKGETMFALFCGDKDQEGVSWCPDCVKAEPVIRGEMKHLPEGSVFIYCLVGERAYWKDPTNDFKKNLKLTGVPTLVKVGTPQKLTEEECLKSDLIQMLFSDD